MESMIRSSSMNSPKFVNPITATTTTSAPPPLNCNPFIRCEGLDLLAMAVLHVAHRRAFNEVEAKEEAVNVRDIDAAPEAIRSRRRAMSMPSKYRDSVLQPWKRLTRRRRRRAINGSN